MDNYVSNSQIDASCKPMYDFQLAFSVKTVKEWLEIRQHIRYLFQLCLLLLDFRPFLQCFMLQRPEHGNAVPHLLNGNLRNRKSSLELSDVPIILGDLSIGLYQPVRTIEFGHEVVQFFAEFAEKHRKQVVFQQLRSTSFLPVSCALAGILGLVALRASMCTEEMLARRAVDHPAEEGQRKPLTPVRTHAKFLLQAKPFIELENRLDANIGDVHPLAVWKACALLATLLIGDLPGKQRVVHYRANLVARQSQTSREFALRFTGARPAENLLGYWERLCIIQQLLVFMSESKRCRHIFGR